MDQHSRGSAAKNFFLYFFVFVMLYIVAINFGGLLFNLIEKAFPATGEFYARFSQGSMRFHLSSLIIGTPIFLFMSGKLYKDANKDESLKHSALRKWLTYITLLVTTLVVIGDLIALVNNLLSGETTTRFILKAIVVLFIAVVVLYYYLQDIKGLRDGMQIKKAVAKMYFIGTIVLVLAAIIFGVFSIEPPAIQRQRINDRERESNLQEIEGAIAQYAQVRQALPANLDEVTLRDITRTDPVTDSPYIYNIKTDSNYTLCATFETSNLEESDNEEFFYPNRSYLHPVGEHCFERSILNILEGEGPQLKPIPIR